MPITLLALLFSFALTGAGTAQAQSYPSRPIKVVVPFAAGGPQDGIIRMLSQKAAAGLSNLSYDPQKDLVAIVQLVDTPMVLVVPDAMPVANLADFIALAKSK